MAYTVKQLLESKQFPDMRLVICKENLNQEIKGIRIIEIEDMERYLTGGELLLTNMKVYFGTGEETGQWIYYKAASGHGTESQLL